MSLILPNQPPKPAPGIQININNDGPTVVLQTLSTSVLSADEAANLAGLISQAATKAKAFEQVMATPLNLPNGVVR